MPIQFSCACGESLSFADEQSGTSAACSHCGQALTVPRVGILVGAGDKLPAVTPKRPAADKPIPVAAPFAPPPGPPPLPPAPRRILPWIAAAAAVLLIVGGPLVLLLRPKDQPPPQQIVQAPPPDETLPLDDSQGGQTNSNDSDKDHDKTLAIRSIDIPRSTGGNDTSPPKKEEPAVDPQQLERLRQQNALTGELAQDVRRELQLLRKKAQHQAESEEMRRKIEQLRKELGRDNANSIQEAVTGDSSQTPFQKLADNGRTALAERDYEIAVRDLTRAAVLNPSDADVIALLKSAREALDKIDKEVPEALEKAKIALLDGDVEQAKNIYEVLMLVAPKDRRVRDAVGAFQARLAKGNENDINTGDSRWLTADEIDALTNRTPLPSANWRLDRINPDITSRSIAYGQTYRRSTGELTGRSMTAGGERTAALQGETDRAAREGRERNAGFGEEDGRARIAWQEGLQGLAEGTGRAGRTVAEAREVWMAQDMRLARINRELQGVWREQGERGRDAAAGQMIGLLQQHGRIAEVVRQHDVLLREQGQRMAGGAAGGRAGLAEQGDRVGRAGREQNAALHELLDRARNAGRQFDAALQAQNERGAIARREGQQGGREMDDRLRGGARAGLDNLTGQGARFSGASWDFEIDRTRSNTRDHLMTGRDWEDHLRDLARDQDRMVASRHKDWLPPASKIETPPPKKETPPPPPQVDDPADRQKERTEADRALDEKNRKAREAAELKRLKDEEAQRRRDVEELKKLVQQKEALERQDRRVETAPSRKGTPGTPARRTQGRHRGPEEVERSRPDKRIPVVMNVPGVHYPHRIRLREPWQRNPLGQGVRCSRRFGYPGRIDSDERVWLTVSGVSGPVEVSLNGHRLGAHDGSTSVEYDVTALLGVRNELVLTFPNGGDRWDEAALEVRRTAFLSGVRGRRRGTHSGERLCGRKCAAAAGAVRSAGWTHGPLRPRGAGRLRCDRGRDGAASARRTGGRR